jgi:hypothetical protein
MSGQQADLERRAARLLRWYPRSWRARYGVEFTELLIADLGDNPRSWRRQGDVAWSGLIARLTSAGLSDHTGDPASQVPASLASLTVSFGVFCAFAIAIWSQLTIGWQWSAPTAGVTYVAMAVMSATMLVLFVLALFAAAPIGWCVLADLARHRSRSLGLPVSAFVAGTAVLLIGAHHFGNGWPGTGGHRWALQGLVPGGIAAFSWASTLSVSSYWAHPHALASFPVAEIAWMAVSPLAMVFVVVGAAKTIRRLQPGPRILRFEARLALVAGTSMGVFLLAACAWVLTGAPGPRGLFHTGAIDVAGVVAMASALTVASRASRRAREGALLLVTR